MSKPVRFCTTSAPPIDLDVHRRIAMRRRGIHGAVARVVAELAFGESRDAVVLIAVAGAGPASAVRP